MHVVGTAQIIDDNTIKNKKCETWKGVENVELKGTQLIEKNTHLDAHE